MSLKSTTSLFLVVTALLFSGCRGQIPSSIITAEVLRDTGALRVATRYLATIRGYGGPGVEDSLTVLVYDETGTQLLYSNRCSIENAEQGYDALGNEYFRGAICEGGTTLSGRYTSSSVRGRVGSSTTIVGNMDLADHGVPYLRLHLDGTF